MWVTQDPDCAPLLSLFVAGGATGEEGGEVFCFLAAGAESSTSSQE